jgi:hypothetical protein
MEKIRVTDDEIVVDSMILASRGEIPPALPSFGRNLVPYFCPNGSTDPTEEDINHATDLDAYRRLGQVFNLFSVCLLDPLLAPDQVVKSSVKQTV